MAEGSTTTTEGAPPPAETKPPEAGANGTEGQGEAKPPDHEAEVKRLTSALDNERKRWEKAERDLAELRKSQMTDQEKAVAEAKAEGRATALRELATKLLEAEVRAQAATRLADPADAVHLLELDGMLADDGTFDAKAIGSALDELVKAKPYLAKTNGPGPGARPPQGARDAPAKSEGDDFIRTLAKNMRS
jgi:hypothetical protein